MLPLDVGTKKTQPLPGKVGGSLNGWGAVILIIGAKSWMSRTTHFSVLNEGKLKLSICPEYVEFLAA